MSAYDCWTFGVATDLSDALVADLWSLGTLGIEEIGTVGGQLRLRAYFPVGQINAEALDAWRDREVDVTHHVLAARDWLAAYRAAAQPIDIGTRFRIDPRDPDDERDAAPAVADSNAGAARWSLRIPARQAFGTGSHGTTRLALTLLETLDLRGRSVLDVGTGSGILAFAASRLGAQRVVGFDIDPIAALIAGQNARLNRCTPALLASRLDALARRPTFEVAVVNVLPERIRDDLPRLLDLLQPEALVISSGNLTTEADAVLATWRSLGLAPVEQREDGSWSAFVLVRDDATGGGA